MRPPHDIRQQRRLRRASAALPCVALIICAATIATAGDNSVNPKHAGGALDPEPFRVEWDFGYVPIDYKMIYTAPVRNIGDDTLRVREVKSTCECTVPTLPERTLPPGSSSTLTVSFNTKDFYGPQERFVEIHSSDPRAPERLLQFRAMVGGHPPEVDMRPRSVFNLPGSEGDTLVIRNYTDSELPFSVVYQDTALFTVETQTWSAPPQGYLAIFMRANPALERGSYYSTFTLEFATPHPVRLSTPVKLVRY
ncbi:MAG TPA: DUF1573 domain-containing protein [candidate division Zixibacteria bacterium]|nr:DUF1573 domain-containing protein [candidate division Zixibacteria bacterium]